MKKIKIILPILAAVLAVAYFVCSLVIPAETKWFMEQVAIVLNYPITIAGVSVTIGGIIAYVLVNFVIKNTKFGRKELDKYDKKYEELDVRMSNYRNDVNEIVTKKINQFAELREDCNNKTTIMLEQFEDLQHTVLNALKTIPNQKVQKIVVEYEDAYGVKRKEIIEKNIHTKDYIDRRFKEIEDMINEAKETINTETEAA